MFVYARYKYKLSIETVSLQSHAFITVRNVHNTEFLTAGVEQSAVRAEHLAK